MDDSEMLELFGVDTVPGDLCCRGMTRMIVCTAANHNRAAHGDALAVSRSGCVFSTRSRMRRAEILARAE